MVTAVSRFIEQVGSMIKGIPKHNYPTHNTIFFLASKSKHAQTVHMHPPAGCYLVLNRILVSRWMHMNWYILANRQVSLLAL